MDNLQLPVDLICGMKQEQLKETHEGTERACELHPGRKALVRGKVQTQNLLAVRRESFHQSGKLSLQKLASVNTFLQAH